MTTLEMMNKAKDDRKTYITGNMRYSSDKGFHQDNGIPWDAKAFLTLNEVLELDDWELLDEVKRMTLKEIEKKLGYKIELVSE